MMAFSTRSQVCTRKINTSVQPKCLLDLSGCKAKPIYLFSVIWCSGVRLIHNIMPHHARQYRTTPIFKRAVNLRKNLECAFAKLCSLEEGGICSIPKQGSGCIRIVPTFNQKQQLIAQYGQRLKPIIG